MASATESRQDSVSSRLPNIFLERACVGRIIAKENFYNKINHATKSLFQSEIARIIWEYKLAPDTINLAAKHWPEIEVFRIELKGHDMPMAVLKTIDSAIPYPILFIITKDGFEKVTICYKTQNQKDENSAKVDTYFETDWSDAHLRNIHISGLTIDDVYENFIRQIAGEKLTPLAENHTVALGNYTAGMEHHTSAPNNHTSADNELASDSGEHAPAQKEHVAMGTSLENDLAKMKNRESIQKQIAAIDRKIKSEPNIGKKQRLAEEKYRLMRDLQ